MTQVEEMADWFIKKGGKATLAEILQSGERWAYEWRARATDARKLGYVITLERGSKPSQNLYRLFPPDQNQMRFA